MSIPSLATFGDWGAAEQADTWSLTIAGDTVFEPDTSTDIGSTLQSRLDGNALSLVNLEAPIAGAGEPIAKTGPVNETVAETPQTLVEMGFDGVTLANNHTMDRGVEGLEHTIDACSAAGLKTVGAGRNGEDALDPLEITIDGQSLAVFDLCEREFGAADRDGPGAAWIDHPQAVARVREAAATTDVVVVIAHGGVEYLPLPPPGYQRRLRRFADVGADLVVGHHPHVPQGWERYDGTPIAYSLGNFRYKRGTRPKTEWGIVLEACFEGATLTAAAARPVERRGDAVAFMGDRWSPEEYRPYFRTTSSIAADRQRLRAHWQELAVRVFEQRYGSWLRTAAGSDLPSMVRHPLQYLVGTRLWDGDRRERELLTLLNLVRNESHRDLIETATSVKTGVRTDRRTPEIRDQVRDLLARTEDRAVYDRPSPLGQLFRGVLSRLWRPVSETGDRLHPRRVSDRL